jgi:hypothetical protein
MTDELKPVALPPLQDALEQIFTDAGGSDMLVDLLAAFNFESSRELAEAITLGMARQPDPAALVEALKPFAAIDLTASDLPKDFAFDVLTARAALAQWKDKSHG